MILADTRHLLSRDDAQLATRVLVDSGEDLARLEARVADEGIDAVLDDPRLPAALLRNARGVLAVEMNVIPRGGQSVATWSGTMLSPFLVFTGSAVPAGLVARSHRVSLDSSMCPT
jgi:hypothetical protein